MKVKTPVGLDEPTLEIRLNNSVLLSLVIRLAPAGDALLGALVMVSREDHLLLHPSFGEMPFHSVVEISPDKSDMYKCPRCAAWVKDDTGHENHCKKNWKPTPLAPVKLPPRPTPFTKSPVVRISSKIEEGINNAMDKVAFESWEAVKHWPTPEERFSFAKREALQLIKMLSPSIRRQVEHRFSSVKWQPLLAREPK